MINLLTRLFVKNHTDVSNPDVRRAYGTMVSIIGIVLNLIISVGKLTVGILFALVSVSADAINNISDAGTSLLALVGFRISAKPADRDHPYGHARMEYIISLAVSFLILMVGIDLLRDSASMLYTSIVHPDEIEKSVFSLVTVGVLVFSIFVKLFLALLNRKIGKKLDSSVMRAAAVDSLSDIASTSAVLVAVIVSHFVSLPFSLDGAMGVVVSVLILIAGVKLLLEAQNAILGKAPTKETVEMIEETVKKYPEILGIHDMAVHEYGSAALIASFHAEVDGSDNIFAIHDTVDNIERELWDEYRIRTTIHLDPIAIGDPDTDAWREMALRLVASIDPRITIHDFRAVRGVTHSNLVFDIAVPFEVKMSDGELVRRIEKAVRSEDDTLYTVITVDRV